MPATLGADYRNRHAKGANNALGEFATEALSEQKALARKPHFEVMDGLRGVAALAIVLFHSFRSNGYVPNGRLAVDLFFILSGFVIAYSYDEQLATAMPKQEFFIRRFIRLYPMLFIGAFGGIVTALIHNTTNPSHAYPTGAVLISGLLSILAIPYLVHDGIVEKNFDSDQPVFSFNPPIWSLFFEMAVNIAYAIWLTIPLVGIIVVSGLAGVAWFGPLGGGSQLDFWAGFPRVACGFFCGVGLFKLREVGHLPQVSVAPAWLFLILICLFSMPFEIGGLMFVPAFLVLAFVVMCASAAKASPYDKYFAFLGLISYPVYLLHWITLYGFAWAGTKLHLMGKAYTAVAMVHLAAIPVIAYAAARYYETPTRLFLTRRLLSTARPSR